MGDLCLCACIMISHPSHLLRSIHIGVPIVMYPDCNPLARCFPYFVVSARLFSGSLCLIGPFFSRIWSRLRRFLAIGRIFFAIFPHLDDHAFILSCMIRRHSMSGIVVDSAGSAHDLFNFLHHIARLMSCQYVPSQFYVVSLLLGICGILVLTFVCLCVLFSP